MTDGSIEEASAFSDAATHDQAELEASKRSLKPSTRRALTVIGIVAVLMALGLVYNFLIVGSRYVSTDNAQIDGDQISVNAPNSGTLLDWTATEGTQLRKDRLVGRIQIQGGFVQPQQPIRAPGNGTVVIDDGVEGAFVTAGTPLAIAYDLSKIYVTARVDETDVDDVRPGQTVDIEVDAFPDAHLTGTVREVQRGAAGEFSPFPRSNTAGNYQKVTQVIPVKIALDDTQNVALAPGMSVTVKIHKDD
jgi:multidrug resistance efflux pump